MKRNIKEKKLFKITEDMCVFPNPCKSFYENMYVRKNNIVFIISLEPIDSNYYLIYSYQHGMTFQIHHREFRKFKPLKI